MRGSETTYGKSQIVTTEEGCHREALPYLTANLEAPAESETPRAIPRGVAILRAFPREGQSLEGNGLNPQRNFKGSKYGNTMESLVFREYAGTARMGEKRAT